MKVKNYAMEYGNEEEANYNLSKPSKEEYEKAKQEVSYFSECIRLSVNRKNELLDELCAERESEKIYRAAYEKQRDIVRRYEIYEELEARSS